ncbi:MAG: DNA mismatch repair protein MutS [Trueperaceae bacterium]|nr:DNA mismatch repair protein MutS [Trueperaceae bacterium]
MRSFARQAGPDRARPSAETTSTSISRPPPSPSTPRTHPGPAGRSLAPKATPRGARAGGSITGSHPAPCGDSEGASPRSPPWPQSCRRSGAAVATGDGYGLALLDVSTGEFRGTLLYAKSSLYDELKRYRPAEVLLAPELYDHDDFREAFSRRFAVMVTKGRFGADDAERQLGAHFGGVPSGLSEPALLRASGAVFAYALETQQGALPQVRQFVRYDPGAYMQLGDVALSTLEVFEGSAPTRTLFSVLDETRTAPGRRLLQAWLRHPLLDQSAIGHRLDAVAAFVHDGVLRRDVRKALYKLHDLERLSTKLASGRATARDLGALARSLRLVPEIKILLADRAERALAQLIERTDNLGEVQTTIEAALVDEPPLKLTEGGLIRDGFDPDLDSLRGAADTGRSWIADLERRERDTTGIPTLKVGFNQVFGYYLEVTRPYYDRVPDSYRPVQTLKDRQRYNRPDLRERERDILRAEEAARNREYQVFDTLRKRLVPHADAVRELGAVLAELDVYTSLADVAAVRQYCRPNFGDTLAIEAGRHPVVERFHTFIPNDVRMSERERLVVLTGPNMSGKSTYLRQTALIALLAQIGSFVPAQTATLPLFERIYTRIGANDDIAGGRSTFMVEMDELATILHSATPKSLVLLDEIGRGTSTYDGLSLAWATAEHLHDRAEAFTLLATHYFELTGLASQLAAARNQHVAAKEEAGGLVFYHQVLPGPASKSYGLEVAKLAGLPGVVLARARTVFDSLEASRDDASHDLIEALLEHDLSRLSPLDALTLLHTLQEQARGVVPDRAEERSS